MILIKIGGGKQINWEYIAEDIASLSTNGEKIIAVHGGNAFMTEISQKLGIKEKTIISPSGHTSRYTDSDTIDLLTMVYSGLVNKKIVSSLQRQGVNAIGLTGADGRIWQGTRKENIISVENEKTRLIRDSQTGVVTSINTSLLSWFLEEGYVPVITIPAITPLGELINVDNDRAIAIMVRDLHIKTFISLFEAPGFLQNPANVKSVVTNIKKNSLQKYMDQTSGRMKKKMLGVKEAFSYGLEKAYFADGRIKNPISSALKGEGTIIQ